MKISCPILAADGRFPTRYTCDGDDVSPPVLIEDVPHDAEEMVLVVDDPDAPRGTFTHWLVWNLDPARTEIAEGASGDLGAREGTNDFGTVGWRGPCPPPGDAPHRYRFTLYAVDAPLHLEASARRGDVNAVMEGHVLEEAGCRGEFGR